MFAPIFKVALRCAFAQAKKHCKLHHWKLDGSAVSENIAPVLRASDVISRERAQASSSADVLPSAGSIFEGVTRRLARLPYTLHAPAPKLEPSSLTACLWLSMCVIRSSPENTDDRIWEAEIWYEGVHYTLGAFKSEETAARAYACAAFSLYDSAAIEVGKQQDHLNFRYHSHAEREKKK